MTQSRIDREKRFHNKTFGEHTRDTTNSYYVVAKRAFVDYKNFLGTYCQGKAVLEYGCGPGGYAYFLTENNARVIGIDISDTAIQQAAARAASAHLDIDFRVMNAEALEFGDGQFDMACGSGILHHLDLKKAFSELTRTLKPGSHAIFFEPLSYNPIIRLYRKLTPQLRTEDEHPLKITDLKLMEQYFTRIDLRFYCFTSLAMILVRKFPRAVFDPALRLFDALDSGIFRLLPFMKRYAWIVVIHAQL